VYVDHLPRVSSYGSTIEMKTSLLALVVGCCYRLNFMRSSTYCFLRELNWFIDLEFDFDLSEIFDHEALSPLRPQ
jgi:hypothetical protein